MPARVLVLVVTLVTCLAAPHTALGDEHDAFYAALARAQAGDARGAADDLAALVARAPTDLFADDALLERARLLEEQLADPVGAATIYELLARDYPDSRLARRAERRAAALRAQLGPGARDAAALAAWQAILASFPTRGLAGSLADAEALLARFPEFGQADELRLWIAERRAQTGAREQAVAELTAIAARDDERGLRAQRALADLWLELGRFPEARAAYEKLRPHAEGLAEHTSLDEALRKVTIGERKRTGSHAAAVVLAVLVLAAAVGLARSGQLGRALLSPPTEVLFVLPIAALFVLAGQSENELFFRATRWLALAQVVIAYVVGVGLRAAPRRAVPILAWGAGGGLAMLAATYLVVYHLDMVDLVVHTVVYGVN